MKNNKNNFIDENYLINIFRKIVNSFQSIRITDPNIFIRQITLDSYLIDQNDDIKLFMMHYSLQK